MNNQEKQLFKVVMPGVYLVAVLCVDRLTHFGTITPFCTVLGMVYMSVNYPPKVMIPWCIIYTATTCLIFLVPGLFSYFSHIPYYHQYVIPVIRAATFIGVGVLASYLCLILNRFWKSEEEMKSILTKLPLPIITSDHNGRILYSNTMARELLPDLIDKKNVKTYFDLLSPPEFTGRTIADYMQRTDNNQHETPIQLEIDGVPYFGFTQTLESTGAKVILTIIVRQNESEIFSLL